MKNTKIINKSRILQILVIVGIVLSFLGVLSSVFDGLLFNFLKTDSKEYLLNSYEESKNFFLTISILKGTLGVIEGSTLNANAMIGVNIELGDIIEPIYDLVNIMWKTVLISTVVLKIETLYFDFFSVRISSYLLTASLILIAPYQFYREKITIFLMKIGKYFFFSFIFIYVLIPVTLILSSKTVNYLEEEYKIPAIKRVEVNIDKISKSAEELFKKDEEKSIFNLSGQASSYKEKITSFQKEARDVTGYISEDIPLIIGINVFGYVLLPLILTYVLYKFIKNIFSKKERA